MLKINLQKFADEDIEPPEETEEVKEETTETEEVTEEKEIDKDKYIPKETALKWKRDLKEYKTKMKAIEEKELERANKDKLDKIRSLAVEKGLSEDVAEIFGELTKELFSAIPKNEDSGLQEDFIEFIEDYPEAKDYKKDILDKFKRYSKADPDFTMEDAYKLVKPKKSIKEMELEAEQRAALARKDKEPPVSQSSKTSPKYNLTEEEKHTVKLLQQAHPEKGWTNEKYYNTVIKPKLALQKMK